MCRSRRELSNAYFLVKFGFDTAENEPLEVWGKIQFTIHFTPYSRWQGNFGLVTPQTLEIGRLLKNLRLEKKERPPRLYVKKSLLKIKNLGGTKWECEGAPFFRYHFWLLYGFRIGSDRRLSRPVGSTQFYPRWLYREPPGIPGS